jgi:beta-galactosidase
MTVPATFGEVEWFGRGPGEAYPDTNRAARVGRFRATVDELQTPYVFPQENGNRTDVRWLTLSDAKGSGIQVAAESVVNFTARRWRTQDLDDARHASELVPLDRIWLNLDLAQQGIGSASCGPETLPEYALHPSAAVLSLTLRAIEPGRG